MPPPPPVAPPPPPPPPPPGPPDKPDGLHSLRPPVTGENFYFVMADRFENGDAANDNGGLEPGTVEGTSGDGRTVARLDGMVFFVEKAVPGDTVRARIWKLKKNFAEATAVEVVTPSKDRVHPKCKHFGVCGGCAWQDLDYQKQLEFKQQRIVESFKRVGGFENPQVLPVIG